VNGVVLGRPLTSLASELGPVEVLEYSPLPAREFIKPILETTVDDVRGPLEFSVLGAVAAATARATASGERSSLDTAARTPTVPDRRQCGWRPGRQVRWSRGFKHDEREGRDGGCRVGVRVGPRGVEPGAVAGGYLDVVGADVERDGAGLDGEQFE
jgi:hypothetical protein